MAQNGDSNAPFLDQQNYAAVTGVSNSPFTDQRAVAAGGGPGPGPGSGGNVEFSDTTGKLGILRVVDPAGVSAVIEKIEQPTPFNITALDLTLEAVNNVDINSVFGNIQLDELSMGMSNDYKVAVQEGATLVRVGTAIFGDRS